MKTLFFLLATLLATFAQSQQPQLDFLKVNTADISGDNIAAPLFDDAFYRNQYFFFGENHGFARPQQTDYSLFTHLHGKAGVKHYIAEVDFTKAWLLNRFLNSGDTTLLNKVFASWVRDTAQWANKEHYQKWVRLQHYQQALSKASRIIVVGVDVVQDVALVAEHFRVLTAGKRFNATGPMLDSLNSIASTGNRAALVAFSKRFYPVADSNKRLLQQALGNNYADFHHLLKSLTLLSAGNTRDKVMYLNLSNQLQAFGLEKAKMYGFLGFFHCLQMGYNRQLPMAALLKQSDAGKKGIVTLAMYVLDSEMMMPWAGPVRAMMPKAQVEKTLRERPEFPSSMRYIPFAVSHDGAMFKVDGIGLLKELSKPSSVQVFRLSGAGSPFAETKALGEVRGVQAVTMTDAADNTLNALQYVVLFRNSKAAMPLSE